MDEVDNDINDLNGPEFIVTRLRTKGIFVPRWAQNQFIYSFHCADKIKIVTEFAM